MKIRLLIILSAAILTAACTTMATRPRQGGTTPGSPMQGGTTGSVGSPGTELEFAL